MGGSMSPAWRPGRRRAAPVVLIAWLVAACGGPAATAGPTPAATLGVATGSAPVSTASPMATEVAAATVVPTTPLVTAPPITAPPIAPSIAPPPTPAPAVGVALRIGDQQLMTVLAAEAWAGAPGVKPATGKAFFTVSIRIDALALTSWDSAWFKVRDSERGYAWRTGRSPHLYDGANMTTGNNYVGWITYEVPKASVDELTLVYKPGFLEDATFRVPLSE